MRDLTIDRILRPNLIIYLDAPTDVVQSKIRARAQTTHPWEKNSPVWENTAYVEELYQKMIKKQYLPVAAESSYVLQYDWSEGGDVEVVVDYHDKYDKQRKDWTGDFTIRMAAILHQQDQAIQTVQRSRQADLLH